MNWHILLCEENREGVVLEQCKNRIIALPLLKYHRDRLSEAHLFSSLWIRDDVNTDSYFLVYRKTYDALSSTMDATHSLQHVKKNRLYVCRIELTCKTPSLKTIPS